MRLDEEGTTAVLDGTTELHWSRGERLPTLEGDLDVVRLRYDRAIRLADFRQLERRAERAEVEEYDPAKDHVALDLRLHGNDNLQVDNNLLDAEFRIDETEGPLRVVGTDQRFGLLGELALTRGTLRFRSYEPGPGERTVRTPGLDLHDPAASGRDRDASAAPWRSAPTGAAVVL